VFFGLSFGRLGELGDAWEGARADGDVVLVHVLVVGVGGVGDAVDFPGDCGRQGRMRAGRWCWFWSGRWKPVHGGSMWSWRFKKFDGRICSIVEVGGFGPMAAGCRSRS
jgi:hypothetical protein